MMSIWDLFFPVSRGISMAAFIGTTVLLLNGKKRDKRTMISIVIANYLTAIYLTELVAEMSDIKHLEGIAFGIGVGGFKLIDRVIEQIFNRISDTIKTEENGNVNNTNSPAE